MFPSFGETQSEGKGGMSMCEVLDKVEKRGIEQGLQQGLQQGIQQSIQQGITILVDSLKELNQTNEIILSKLMEKFHLSEAEAKKYIS